jgi:inhibitor of KinA sporulation pathway (predicted exonuclease)
MDFRKWFDFRTVKLIRNLLKIPETSFIGTRHNALDDAINQALFINQILYHLNTTNLNYPKLNVNKPEPISRKKNLEIDDSEYTGPRIEDLDLIVDMNS